MGKTKEKVETKGVTEKKDGENNPWRVLLASGEEVEVYVHHRPGGVQGAGCEARNLDLSEGISFGSSPRKAIMAWCADRNLEIVAILAPLKGARQRVIAELIANNPEAWVSPLSRAPRVHGAKEADKAAKAIREYRKGQDTSREDLNNARIPVEAARVFLRGEEVKLDFDAAELRMFADATLRRKIEGLSHQIQDAIRQEKMLETQGETRFGPFNDVLIGAVRDKGPTQEGRRVETTADLPGAERPVADEAASRKEADGQSSEDQPLTLHRAVSAINTFQRWANEHTRRALALQGAVEVLRDWTRGRPGRIWQEADTTVLDGVVRHLKPFLILPLKGENGYSILIPKGGLPDLEVQSEGGEDVREAGADREGPHGEKCYLRDDCVSERPQTRDAVRNARRS